MKKPNKSKRTRKASLFRVEWTQGSARRVLLALVTAGCLFMSSWTRILPPRHDLQEGDTAPTTIRAPRGGFYVDPDEMDQLREEAANSVADIYDADPHATNDAMTALRDAFARFNSVREDPQFSSVLEKVRELRKSLDITLSTRTLELAVSSATSTEALERYQHDIEGITRAQLAKDIRRNTDDLGTAKKDLADAARGLRLSSDYTDMVTDIGQALLTPNRTFSVEKTEEARQEKRDSVQDVVHPVQTGDLIILAREEVRTRHIKALEVVGLMQPAIDYTQALSILLTVSLMVLILGVFTARFVPDTYLDFGQLVTVAALLVVTTFAYRTLESTSWFEAGAITLAVSASMIVALLIDVRVGMATGVCLALLLPVIAAGNDARFALTTLLCSVTGVFAVSGGGSKSSIIVRAAVVMALFDGVMVVAGGEVFGLTVSTRQTVIAALGGLVSPLLAMGASVALSRLIGVTTDFRLMELGNPNEPVLRRLLADAPGSYQSSVMVGNLAEPAAEAIGANALLVRTAAIYHDIGKIRRPYFFVENQFGGDNPHDRLSPHLSALVITAHVRDGLELAGKHGLPTIIRDAIAQHHGTTLVRYFYQRAVKLADDPEDVLEVDFRYPGPKPQSREIALLMLADSVEAAARTLETPSQQDIQELVDRIVGDKQADGQLDESPLSFKDLMTIKRAFTSTLTGMFHQRVKYPDQIVREAQKAEEEARERGEGVAGGTDTEAPPPNADGKGPA